MLLFFLADISTPVVSFFFRAILYWLCFVQCLGSDQLSFFFYELQNGLLFSRMQLSGLHGGLPLKETTTTMQSAEVKPKSGHSELLIVYVERVNFVVRFAVNSLWQRNLEPTVNSSEFGSLVVNMLNYLVASLVTNCLVKMWDC